MAQKKLSDPSIPTADSLQPDDILLITRDPSGSPQSMKIVGANVGDRYFRQDFTTTTSLAVNHNLNKRPAVTVVDSAGDVLEVDIDFVDDNNITLDLGGGFAGSVYCN